MNKWTGLLPILVTTLLTLSLTAQGEPSGVRHIQKIMADMERSEADAKRDLTSKPAYVLALLRLEPGDRVADIFAGGGYYSEILAELVAPNGEVLVHNNQAYLGFVGKQLDERMATREMPGFIRHDREEADMALGINNLDAAMIVMSYHDLYHTAPDWGPINVENFMGQIARALKSGGRFLIVDHVAPDGTGKDYAQERHRIEPSFARRDIERFGLRYIGGSDILRNRADDYEAMVFDPSVRGKTDRFIQVFEKP